MRWLGDGRLGDSQRPRPQHQEGIGYEQGGRSLEHQNVTPRRDGETHGSPKLRRKSTAQLQDWGGEGVKRLGQIGNQLGIGGRCKVHMKVRRGMERRVLPALCQDRNTSFDSGVKLVVARLCEILNCVWLLSKKLAACIAEF